jgi:hypothetical protein
MTRYVGWQIMAMRDAALTVYHVRETLEALDGAIRRCPHACAVIGRKPFDAAAETFRRHFPHAKRLRHAIGHSAELARTIQQVRANTSMPRLYEGRITAGFGIALALPTGWIDDRLTLNHKGAEVSLDLTEISLEQLYEVRRIVMDAAAPLEGLSRPGGDVG